MQFSAVWYLRCVRREFGGYSTSTYTIKFLFVLGYVCDPDVCTRSVDFVGCYLLVA